MQCCAVRAWVKLCVCRVVERDLDMLSACSNASKVGGQLAEAIFLQAMTLVLSRAYSCYVGHIPAHPPPMNLPCHCPQWSPLTCVTAWPRLSTTVANPVNTLPGSR